MSKAACTFRESEIARAVRAVAKAGQPVAGVRFERGGGFTVLVGGEVPTDSNPSDTDQELQAFEARHG
jgi:hypothetical protein